MSIIRTLIARIAHPHHLDLQLQAATLWQRPGLCDDIDNGHGASS